MNTRVVTRTLPRPRKSAWRRLSVMLAIRRQRRGLRRLEPHLRRDIGLSDSQIGREADRPFWDIPDWWR